MREKSSLLGTGQQALVLGFDLSDEEGAVLARRMSSLEYISPLLFCLLCEQKQHLIFWLFSTFKTLATTVRICMFRFFFPSELCLGYILVLHIHPT